MNSVWLLLERRASAKAKATNKTAKRTFMAGTNRLKPLALMSSVYSPFCYYVLLFIRSLSTNIS